MKLKSYFKLIPGLMLCFAFGACQDKTVLSSYDPNDYLEDNSSDKPDQEVEIIDSEHPRIWITQEERPKIIEKIRTTPWAAKLVEKMKDFIDADVQKYLESKSTVIGAIRELEEQENVPETESSSLNSAHTKVLFKAQYAAILYYLNPNGSAEKKYAQYAADIMMHYFFQLAKRTPQTATVCGYEFYDARCSFARLALTYDFVYTYLAQEGSKVYDHTLGVDVDYDNEIAQKALINIAGNIFKEYTGKPDNGGTVSNHPVLTAPGALYTVMCVQDPEEHEHLLNLFWEEGTANQNSCKNTLIPMFGEQGIWPESVSYGFMPSLTLVLNVLDRYRPEWNIFKGDDLNHILEGNFLFDNLRYPDRSFVSYGDSHRYNDSTDELYWITLNIAKRRGKPEIQKKAEIALSQQFEDVGPFAPGVTDSPFDVMSVLLPLFWCESIPDNISGAINFQTPTVNILHAGVSLQRNYVDEDNEKYGLCGYIGGGYYVHNQSAGISMELYGAGCVNAPSGGLPKTVAERNQSPHKDYFVRYAGNNTVIVNEKSRGGDSPNWKANWYTYQNTAENVGCEPKHLEDPINKNFSFTTQHLDDKVNNCEQERTLAILRTSSTTGYYFDMFRSKSNDTEQIHDYVYHNISDRVDITKQNGDALTLAATNKYTNHDSKYQSPGWKHFDNKKSTDAIDDAVKACFKLTGTCMNMWMPGGENREYTTALGPETRDIAKDASYYAYKYLTMKTPIVVIRQESEAWSKPFVVIFEPSQGTSSSIKSVDNLYYNGKIVGAKVVSEVAGKSITDYIICNDNSNATVNIDTENIEFKGRYGVVRVDQNGHGELYIGDGDYLIYNNSSLTASGGKGTVKI